MAELAPGTEFAGHRIEAVVGRGGMGVVYRATHIALDLPVALKVIAPEHAQDETFRERFKHEARMAAGIEDPHVVPVRDAGEADGQLYVTMRFVEGSDLRRLLRERGRLDPGTAAAIAAQVGRALDAAHAGGLIHRDVKPANVLLEERGERLHAYLTDFGLTRSAAATSGFTRTGRVVGTLAYIAPERIEGKPDSPRSDIYSLGCMLFESLTGRVPFQREGDAGMLYAHLNEPPPSAAELAPEVPVALDAVIARAMAKDPEGRYGSAGELGAEARAAAAGEAVSAATTRIAEEETTREAMAATAPAVPAPEAVASEPTAATREIRERRVSRALVALVPVAGIAALAVALASGGGGDEGGGGGGADGPAGPGPQQERAAFVSGAERICTRIEADVEAVYDGAGTQLPAPADQPAILAERAAVVRDGVARLRAHAGEAPTAELGSLLSAYAATRGEFADQLAARGRALEAGNGDAAARATAELQRLVDRKIDQADAIGMAACADRLPDVDERKVRSLAVSWLQGDEPANDCSEQITPEFLATEFGGSEDACIADRDAAAEEVTEVREPEGVNGVHATVEAVVGGRALRVFLDEEDGVWKVDGVAGAGPG